MPFVRDPSGFDEAHNLSTREMPPLVAIEGPAFPAASTFRPAVARPGGSQDVLTFDVPAMWAERSERRKSIAGPNAKGAKVRSVAKFPPIEVVCPESKTKHPSPFRTPELTMWSFTGSAREIPHRPRSRRVPWANLFARV